MAGIRRRNLASSRRRIGEEGEDEELGGNDIDDSQSDASLLSDDQVSLDGSDTSETNQAMSHGKDVAADKSHKQPARSTREEAMVSPEEEASQSAFTATADMNAMRSGLGSLKLNVEEEPIAFEDKVEEAAESLQVEIAHVGNSENLTTGKRESHVARARREAEAPRDKGPANPAFVPNRGGFFMHDYRNEHGNPGGPGRGRGKATGPLGNAASNTSYSGVKLEAKMGRWDHDLHEANASGVFHSQPAVVRALASQRAHQPQTPQVLSPSRTISLGTVLVRIFLPWMDKPVNFPKTPVKQHTQLPDLRPPLRRDKPVRVLLPGHQTKYIFPNSERSFVFIPRSQRPNQQIMRGPGRSSFQGQSSRRASAQGGSSYAPSVARSRRSSQARDSMASPSESAMPRAQVGMQIAQARPVVKLPAGALPAVLSPPSSRPHTPTASEQADQIGPLAPGVPQQRNHVDQLPMHQPRPQKTVSVASIESPAPMHFHAPMQQEQQPFHHQVPAHMGGILAQGDSTHLGLQPSFQNQMPSGTPLSNMADRVLHAQPFQPSGMQQPQYYHPVYPMQNYYYYPQAGPSADAYASSLSGWNASNPLGAPTPATVTENPMSAAASNTYAHESNGMVYYYDPTQVIGNVEPANFDMAPGFSQIPGQDGYMYNQAGQAMLYYPAPPQ